MAIRIIEGKIGSGKTYYAVNHVFRSWFRWCDITDSWIPKNSDLEVKVDVEENNIVKLELTQEISDVATPLENPLIESPSFTTKVIQMSTLVDDGQKIYIGGLMETVEENRIKKIPFLGDIPYLGKVFRSEDNVKTKTELILLLSVDVLNKESDFKRQKIKYIRKA